MPRELTNLEVEGFLQRHADVQQQKIIIDGGGYASLPLAYPNAGVAVKEPSGRYVLVWKDASSRWHFIDLSDMSQMDSIARATNQAPFVSDPQYLELIQSAVSRALNLTVSGLEFVPFVVGGLVLYEFLKRR